MSSAQDELRARVAAELEALAAVDGSRATNSPRSIVATAVNDHRGRPTADGRWFRAYVRCPAAFLARERSVGREGTAALLTAGLDHLAPGKSSALAWPGLTWPMTVGDGWARMC